ncbi:melanocyte-stimulating hormone receptor-like [Stylophora pistillata]|uniref:melanocyte-stimulating hormone receptor-like n=1 Tax=Stylophora pistillata TaxID=50429 RepID=UPI000C056505|nr:melanocyte-stimulating hormone receptor-like [Stylophora pistillata]
MNTSLRSNHTDQPSDNSIPAWNIALIVLNAPLSLLTVVTNSVVLLAIWKTTSLHTPSSMLLCNLAISDLAVGLLIQPLYMFHALRKLVVTFDRFYPITMPLYNVVGYCLCGVSFFTVTFISLDRMIALKFHLRYYSLVTMNKTALAIAVIWMVSGIFSSTKVWQDTVLYPYLAFTIIFCLFSNFYAYFEVYKIVIRHQAQIHSQMQAVSVNADNGMRFKQLRRSALNTFYFYCLLLVCYLPYFATVVAGLFIRKGFAKYYSVPSTIVFLNSTLNPFMYFWRQSDIRQAVKRILKLSGTT